MMNSVRFLASVAAILAIALVTTATTVRADDRYAFYDASGHVVQVITGPLTDEQLAIFMQDYAILFHAVSYAVVDESVAIGDGSTPAPSAEPTPSGSDVVVAPSDPAPTESVIPPCQ